MQTGAAWPSSARVLRCSINFCNGRNPYFDFIAILVFIKYLNRGIKRLTMRYGVKVGSMSGRHGLYRLGYIRATMAVTMRSNDVSLSKT